MHLRFSSFSAAFCSFVLVTIITREAFRGCLAGLLTRGMEGYCSCFVPFQSVIFFCRGLKYDHCNRITTAVSLKQNTTHFELTSSVRRWNPFMILLWIQICSLCASCWPKAGVKRVSETESSDMEVKIFSLTIMSAITITETMSSDRVFLTSSERVESGVIAAWWATCICPQQNGIGRYCNIH